MSCFCSAEIAPAAVALGLAILGLVCGACGPVDPPPSGDGACNGWAELCDRPFDQVALPATHNAMANADEGWVAPNQQHPMLQQLQDGVRGMLLDTYEQGGELLLCHSNCVFGSKPLLEALQEVRAFLDEHPREVLALMFQDSISPQQTAGAFEAAGLSQEVYTHVPGSDWPTLGEMIESSTRLVISAEFSGPPPAWHHHAWELYFDTPYSFSSVDQFSCDLNRGSPDNPLFLLNHWVHAPLPAESLSAEVNREAILGQRGGLNAENENQANGEEDGLHGIFR